MLVEEYNSMHKAGYRGPLEKYFKTKTLQRLKERVFLWNGFCRNSGNEA